MKSSERLEGGRGGWPFSVLVLIAVATVCWFVRHPTVLLNAVIRIGVIAVLVTVVTGGLRGPGVLLRALRAERLGQLQLRVLSQAANASVAAGFGFGLLAVLMILVAARWPAGGASPVQYVQWMLSALHYPLAGVLLGRVFLGALLERQGAAPPPDHAIVTGGVAMALATAFGLAQPV